MASAIRPLLLSLRVTPFATPEHRTQMQRFGCSRLSLLPMSSSIRRSNLSLPSWPLLRRRSKDSTASAYITAPASDPNIGEIDPKIDDSSSVSEIAQSFTAISWGLLWSLLTRRKFRLAVSLFTLLGCTTCTLSMPIFSGRFFKVLVGAGSGPLWKLLSKLGVLYALEPVFTIIFVVDMTTIKEKVMSNLRAQIFQRVLIQKFYMQNFTTKIVNLIKAEGLYASQGGPIILSQIENEYQNIEAAFKEKGPSYVRWAAAMVVKLQTGVPWVMCKQSDAPDPVINTCNGMRCDETFQGPNSPSKPSMWTENWTSFYQVFGGEPYIRSAEDIAFHVVLFIAKKGCYVNYYMYHGGTNFGRRGAAYVTTSYYDEAPLDEYGLTRQPKWGHLKQLHAAINLCSTTLLHGVQTNFSLGQLQAVYVFQEKSGGCAAFLINYDKKNNATVQFQNISFELLPGSISILPDCKHEMFNTALVKTEYNKRTTTSSQMFDSEEMWEEYRDVIPSFSDSSIISNTLLEHMNTTKDETDYLWYSFSIGFNQILLVLIQCFILSLVHM